MSVAILILVCCDEAEATSKENITNKVMNSSIVKPVTEPVILYLDDMTFTDAFRVQYLAKGEHNTFWWRNNQYTTNLAQIITIPNVNHFGWVLNNDDPDDNCRSNKLDDCGVCDGLGRMTWFHDKDGDGLGTFMEWITSCTYPTDMEIEKYQYESLQEGGGDQGR